MTPDSYLSKCNQQHLSLHLATTVAVTLLSLFKYDSWDIQNFQKLHLKLKGGGSRL